MTTPIQEPEQESEQNTNLATLLRAHGVPVDMWDVILFGDGSGSNWKVGGGFACVAIIRSPKRREVITGSFSHGTSQLMELYPYVHALYWLIDNWTMDFASEAVGRQVRVHVFSDSDLIVKQGSGQCGVKKMGPLWASIDDLARRFHLSLKWHWSPRDRWGLNVLCDHLSRSCRLIHQNQCKIGTILPGVEVSLINPGP